MISSLDLINGDLIVITPEMKIPADILLIEGQCIINEGILTGESIPIKKSSYEKDSAVIQSNILLAGTQCMMSTGKTENQAFGLVLNTGYFTFKG